jgi:hypothetical protein
MEQNVLKTQLGFLIDQSVGPILNFVSEVDPADGKAILDEVNSIKVDTSEDDKITESNNKIIVNTVITVSIVVISVIVIIAMLYLISGKLNSGFFTSFKLKPIIIESLIILLFVALTEFAFLLYFGSRYISIDVNKVKIALLEKIKSYIITK